MASRPLPDDQASREKGLVPGTAGAEALSHEGPPDVWPDRSGNGRHLTQSRAGVRVLTMERKARGGE